MLKPSNRYYQTMCNDLENLYADALYPDTQKPAITKWFDEVIQLRANQLRLDQQTLITHFARSHMSITHANCHLNLLTAHKSKGLEYDHVIIMHTEKKSQAADTPMLYAEASPTLIQPTFLPNNTNTAYLKQLNKKRDEFESMRLLYVAATRAKYTLHLISHPGKTTSSWISAFELTPNAKHTFTIHQHTDAEYFSESTTPVLSYHLETPQLQQPQTTITDFTVQSNEYGITTFSRALSRPTLKSDSTITCLKWA